MNSICYWTTKERLGFYCNEPHMPAMFCTNLGLSWFDPSWMRIGSFGDCRDPFLILFGTLKTARILQPGMRPLWALAFVVQRFVSSTSFLTALYSLLVASILKSPTCECFLKWHLDSLGEKASNRWLPIFIAGCTSPAASPQRSANIAFRNITMLKKRSISDFFFGHIKIALLRPIGALTFATFGDEDSKNIPSDLVNHRAARPCQAILSYPMGHPVKNHWSVIPRKIAIFWVPIPIFLDG